MHERLIITNGAAAASIMRDAGFDAELLPWRDVLHDGPVPQGLALEELSKLRSEFLLKEFGVPPLDAEPDFVKRDAALRAHARYSRIELWFEHDLYDQLQLLQILDFFAENWRDGLLVMQADDYLGTQEPKAMSALQTQARPVTAEQIETAQAAWQAFCAPKPQQLATFCDTDHAALPHLVPALRRLLQELPAVRSGLSLTESRILSALTDGPRTAGELFRITQAEERARFLGDLSFFRRLDDMSFVATPLIAGLPYPSKEIGHDKAKYAAFVKSRLQLTEAGKVALTGDFDHAGGNKISRWLGGTHVTPDNLWRRGQDDRLVAPSPAL